MKKLFTILATACLVTLIAACGDDDDSALESNTSTPAGASSPSPPVEATQPPIASPVVDVCQPNPSPADITTNEVRAPKPGTQSHSPLVVAGKISAFEAAYIATLYDADGNTISTENGHSSEGQTLAPFLLPLNFSVSEETPACLWVYESSARDGTPVNVAQVPVTLLP